MLTHFGSGICFPLLKPPNISGSAGEEKSVEDVMITKVVSMRSTDRISNARKLMKERGLSQLHVLENGSLAGMITERSLLDVDYDGKCGDFLDSNYAVVGNGTPLSKARERIRNAQAVIVTDGGKVAGILTKSDFI